MATATIDDPLIGGRPDEEPLPARIEDQEEARRYIDAIDFETMKSKNESSEHGGIGWPRGKLDFVERQYKNWLFLRRKYEGQPLPPPEDIDDFWHLHILDTRAYHRDTAAIFGYYLHHFPYFGIRSDEDKRHLDAAFAETEGRYREEFDDEIWAYDEELDG